jgi:hypothetical protein
LQAMRSGARARRGWGVTRRRRVGPNGLFLERLDSERIAAGIPRSQSLARNDKSNLVTPTKEWSQTAERLAEVCTEGSLKRAGGLQGKRGIRTLASTGQMSLTQNGSPQGFLARKALLGMTNPTLSPRLKNGARPRSGWRKSARRGP